MITLTLKDKSIIASVSGNMDSFNNSVQLLKKYRFQYNSKTKEWSIPWYKYSEVKQSLENYDEVVDKVNSTQLLNLKAGNKEQEIESVRRIPDYSLMNYDPIIGKYPNENFQKQGISIGINRSRYYYAWDCGSGKSYVTAAIIAHRLYKYKDCSKVVLLTSNIGVHNLYHELFKFIKDLDPSKVKIADKNYRDPFDDSNIDIVVASYSTFRLICEYYKKRCKITSKCPKKPFLPLSQWSGGKPLMLMLDEAHAIDNHTSIQSSVITLHAKLFKYRYFFSATPFDKVEKQWSPLTSLDPWITWNLSYYNWLDKLAVLGDRFSRYSIKDWHKNEVEEQNKRFLSTYGNFYKTEDILDLPNYMEKKIYIDMLPEHRKIYENFVSESLPEYGNTRDLVNMFPYLSLSLDDPTLLDKHKDKFSGKLQTLIDKFKFDYLAKFEALDDILADCKGQKVLVWATHPNTIKAIAEHCKSWNPIVIVGETPQEERFEMVEQFKTDNHMMLCGNISCLNTSITLTEVACQVYFSRAFNYIEYAQSKCRIYRYGQNQDVRSYILIYNKSLDCLLDKNLNDKGKLVEGLASKKFLTQDEWVKVFNCCENDKF